MTDGRQAIRFAASQSWSAALPNIPRLDTFRAIAALAVVWTHYFEAMLPAWLANIAFGGAGVTFFFVLSGYLITQVLLADEGADWWSRIKRFAIRRSFRIFPLYYFVLTAGLLLGIRGFAEGMPWSWLYLTNFCPLLCADDGLVYTGHLWSLAVEEQFYLVWPWLVVFLPRRWLTAVTLGIVAFVYAYIHVASQYLPGLMPTAPVFNWSPFLHLPSLLIGSLLAIATHAGRLREAERVLRWLLPLTVPALLLLSLDLAPAAHSWHYLLNWPYRPLAQVLFFAWLIARAALDGPKASSWGGKFLPWLGSISYGIYVYHLPIRSVFDTADPQLRSWALRFAGVALTVIVADISYRYLENPLRKFGRGLAARSATATGRAGAKRLPSADAKVRAC